MIRTFADNDVYIFFSLSSGSLSLWKCSSIHLPSCLALTEYLYSNVSSVKAAETLNLTDLIVAFSPGHTSLFLGLKDVGGINSTALRSDNLTSVTKLWIDNAGVTGISDEAFGSFRSLLSLSLEQNLLTEMNPAWLGRPSILSELSLRGNLIEVVEESMLKGLTGLSTLNLSRNRITTIHPNSFGLHTNLSDLDLSENRMTRVSTRVFMPLISTRIRLDGNPWDCSCEAWDFINYLRGLWNVTHLYI